MSNLQFLIGILVLAVPFILDYREVNAKGECRWRVAMCLPLAFLAMAGVGLLA
jgi:hypothetical protein